MNLLIETFYSLLLSGTRSLYTTSQKEKGTGDTTTGFLYLKLIKVI